VHNSFLTNEISRREFSLGRDGVLLASVEVELNVCPLAELVLWSRGQSTESHRTPRGYSRGGVLFGNNG